MEEDKDRTMAADPNQRQLRNITLAEDEEALEIKSLRRIISAYLNYPDAAEEDVRRYERSFRKLPPEHKAILSHLPLKYQKLRRCISVNTFFIINMLQAFEPPLDMSRDIDIADDEDPPHLDATSNHEARNVNAGWHACSSGCKSVSETEHNECEKTSARSDTDKMLEKEEMHMGTHQELFKKDVHVNSELQIMNSMFNDGIKTINHQNQDDCGTTANGSLGCSPCEWFHSSLQLNVPLVDVDKVRCIIRNIVRDWSSEGQIERDQCYKPILEELDRLFPDRCKQSPPTCLVPGAGLGRLALDISCLGFVSQGNEFSYYMMICSSFILNHTQVAGEWKIYPWIHSNCNSISDDDQLRPVSLPDIHPASAGITEGFSMCGGDFVEVYGDISQQDSWDAVVTCFFLDTAHNIVEYIEILSRILKDGGVWINLGPLLYHFADAYGADNEMSIELSLEDVKNVAFHYGFEMEVEKNIETTYTTNPLSMMQNRYFTAFWTMRKRARA